MVQFVLLLPVKYVGHTYWVVVGHYFSRWVVTVDDPVLLSVYMSN